MRLTIRKLMLIVVGIALVLMTLRTGAWVIAEIQDAANEPFGKDIKSTHVWDLGSTPTVVVDCFEGTIIVTPSTNARVSAQIQRVALAEDHRSAAEEGVRSIKVDCDVQGDTLRIVARGASEPMVRKDVRVDLQVPPHTRLDLRTGRGDIVVGWIYRNNAPVCVPIISPSIRARNDSPYRIGYAEANIQVACRAPRSDDATASSTRLQLDASGRIEVDADQATVEARLWHGVVPPGWTRDGYEDGQEGIVLIRGGLVGESTIRAAHGIEMHLPLDAACRVEAEAHHGAILGTVLPEPLPMDSGINRWVESVGDNPTSSVRLRTDDGSIRIDRSP